MSEKMRYIRVTGRGAVRLQPDLTRITLSIRGTEAEYTATMERSSRDTAALREAVTSLGFAPGDLKTLSFSVDTRYESRTDDKGVWTQHFVGYEYSHMLKLEFAPDNELLGRLMYALAQSSVDAEFHISYTVRDREAAKNALLADAVRDASSKAAVLAQAAGVRLGSLHSIDYSWGEVNFEVQPVNRMLMADAAPAMGKSYDMDVTPDDIEVTDTVTVVWEI